MPNYLLIDDDDIIQFVHRNVLSKAHPDAHVTAVFSGDEATDFLKACADEDWPEMVFLDINMPMQSGFEFLDGMKKHLPELHAKLVSQSRLFLLTSSVNPKDVASAAEHSEIEQLLSKPLTQQTVKDLEGS